MTPSVGKPLPRRDGRAKVTGEARYTAEIELPGVVHAVLVDSTIASGRIVRLDTARAEGAPGVLGVITHQNRGPLNPCRVVLDSDPHWKDMMGHGAGEQRLPLADDRIVYSGQHIAVVIGETLEQATWAASLVQAQYETAKPVVDMADAMPSAFVPPSIWQKPADTEAGDFETGFAQAPVRIDETYFTAIQNHNCMETHATVADWEDGRLTLYESSTWVFGVRKAVATWLGMNEEDVRVVEQFVGGSFGSKGPTWNHVALTALAARQVKRPVKLVVTRRQEFTSVGYRPRLQHRIQLGAERDGTLTAIAHHAIEQSSTFETRVVAPVTKTTRKLYACPNVKTTFRVLRSNMPGPFTMRGPGETPGLFAVESAMDELAYALSMDPVELRLKNYAETDPEEHKPWSSKSLRQCYSEGARRFGWEKRNPQPRSMRSGPYLIGCGMASMAYDAKVSPASAKAILLANGRVTVQSATCDQGTGSYTIMAQIASDALGVPVNAIRFELGDTRLPNAPVSAGSQTAASVGSAVREASESLRAQLLDLALTQPDSLLRGHPASDIVASDSAFSLKSRPTVRVTFREILERGGKERMEATASIKPGDEHKKYTCYSFGAHFVEVRVHEFTGETQVTRWVGAFGAGRILNPRTAHSQLVGGIVWGIGMALMEQTVYDSHRGRIVNSDLAEYHVPVNADIPEIDAFFVEEVDPLVDVLGVKGIGELGNIGAPAAIANAVYHATGRRIRELPITPDKLL